MPFDYSGTGGVLLKTVDFQTDFVTLSVNICRWNTLC